MGYSASQAQECPEFKNMINLLVDGQLQSLESPSVENKTQKKGLYRGFDTSIILEGASSPVSANGASMEFIYRPLDAEIHPSQQINFYPFEDLKGDRKLSTGGMNMFGGTKDKKQEDTSINLKFEKVQDGCYKVTFTKTVPPGQYAFCIGEAGYVDVTGQGWGGGKGVASFYALTVN
jgi:hypothetical protein